MVAAAAVLIAGCASRKTAKVVTPEEAKSKIGLNLSQVDEEGLVGPPNGKRAMAYEFCIPGQDAMIAEVKAIDKTAEVTKGARGRSGCGPTEALVVGSTHQKGYRDVLQQLAMKPYVKRIMEVVFER